jgi:hypothetical protein
MTREDRPERPAGECEEGTCKTGSSVIRDLKSWTILRRRMKKTKAFCWIPEEILMQREILAGAILLAMNCILMGMISDGKDGRDELCMTRTWIIVNWK